MDRTLQRLLAIRLGCVPIGLLVLWLAACHDAPRQNPMDSKLTPAVELLSVTADSLKGTATLTWSQYGGDQPFRAYRIDRRLSGEINRDTRATIEDAATTTFVDTGVEVDRTYVYTVFVINTAGLEVASDPAEVSFTFEPPRFHEVTFDSWTASATLSWSRAVSGFVYYQVQRETKGESGTLILHRTTEIDETTFTDTGLDGNTEYAYTVTTRSTTGRELQSEQMSGMFHGLREEWTVPLVRRTLTGAAVDPEDRIYIGQTDGFRSLDPAPALSRPDVIMQVRSQEQPLNEFPPDPSLDPPFFRSAGLAADRHGIYVLLRKPTSLLSQSGVESYVNAFDSAGRLRFRWPQNENKINLFALSMSPKGSLWVAQADQDPLTGQDLVKYHLIDPETGDLQDTFGLQVATISPFASAIASIGNGFGTVGGTSQPVVAFDLTTRELLPADFSGGTLSEQVNDFALGPGDRLYVQFRTPPRIEVLGDLKYVTSWQLSEEDGQVPSKIAFDSQGNIVFITVPLLASTVKIQVFER